MHRTEDNHRKSALGLWLYLMTDLMLFASLFATYFVLTKNQDMSQYFSINYVLIETLLLLTSSFTAGLAVTFASVHKTKLAVVSLVKTFLLGFGFLAMEIIEFRHLIHDGNGPTKHGALSSYFTLVGTHGLHIFIGLLWLSVLLIYLLRTKKLSKRTLHKLKLFSLYWHFLDVVWIFIFTYVYLRGAL